MILILYPTHFGTFDGGREGAGGQALFCVLFCYVLFFIFKSVIAKFMTMMIIFMEGAGSFTEVFRISLESSKVLHFLSAIN